MRNLAESLTAGVRACAPLRAWIGSLAYLKFLLFDRHRYNRLVLERVAGRPLLVLPQVFNPKLLISGEWLACLLAGRLIARGSEVLDMGTGSGVGAVLASARARTVTAVDINPEAVRCARLNVLLNRAEGKVTVQRGDLFSGLKHRRFDVVLFNPPFYGGRPDDWLGHAWKSTDTVRRFAAELPRHLTGRGYALVVFSSAGHPGASLDTFLSLGYRAEKIATKNLIHELLTLYQLRPRPARARRA